ncbi:MAG: PKD domain-containing protein [Chitinophagales bacterium]|nr:PKD domain-containing protein [Chitinophagales bacterium]
MKVLALFIGIIIGCLSASATHIIGGVLSYQYDPLTTAINRYEITMVIFRDCNSNTPFDGEVMFGTPAKISIFEQGTNQMIDTVNLWNPVITSVQPPINSPCLNITTNVCVEQGVYVFKYDFPDVSKGYYVTYERCCRNGTINNLQNPGGQGATYTVDIPPTIFYQNNNPVFNQFPPIFICANAPLVFNHSANDVDGDSLVYSLCDPLDGESQFQPSPIATSKPYQIVAWQPPFNAVDPLGGVPLAIDPNTGVITGTPTSLGQFVVGVCVEEYRNGVLLSTTLRDFQFNVTTCNFPVAGIPGVVNIDPVSGIGDFTINCVDLTVDFENGSVGATSYFWDFGDPNSTSDTSEQFEPSYTYSDTGVYLVTLIASNSLQCKDTIVTRVSLFPVFNTDFEYFPACADTLIQFIDSSFGQYGVLDKWKWNFGDGVGTSNLQNPSYQYSTGGLFNVTLISESSKGCIDTASKQVTVYPVPVANFVNVSACIYDTIQFNYTSNGNIVSSTIDFGDGSPMSNLNNPAHAYQQAGIYNVTLSVISNLGCKDTVTKQLQVFGLPVVTASEDTVICPGSSTSVNVSGANSYQWSPPSLFSNPSVFNPVVNIPSGQYIFVEGTDLNGCRNQDSIFVDVFPFPMIDAGKDTSVCLEANSFRDSVTLNATGGISYTWSPVAGLDDPNIFNPTSRPVVNTTYYVTAVDTNGCVGTDSVRVYFLDPKLDLIAQMSTAICVYDTVGIPVIDLGLITTYTWTPTVGVSDPNIREPSFFPIVTTEYILTVANYCYFTDDSVTVNVNQLPMVNTGILDSICIGDSIMLNAEGGLSYLWDPDPTISDVNIPNPLAFPDDDNTYYVTVVDSIGCANYDSITILVYFPPITSTGINDERGFICVGQSVYLSAAGGVSYLWQSDPTLFNIDSVSPLATPTDTHTYYVTVTNKHGCFADDTLVVDVQPELETSVDTSYSICENSVLKLKVSGGFYYQWIPATYLNYDYIADPVVNPLENIEYLVEVSNDCFLDTVEISVMVQPLPVADAGEDKIINRGNFTQLEGEGGVNYLWLPIDGLNDPTYENTMASPFETTTFVLRVQDEYGCTDYDSMTVFVNALDLLLVPSGFSPNHDGNNDRFGILESSNVEEIYEFAVYNRWGEKVFSTTNIDDSWDGTYKGSAQEMGTYTFAIDYLNFDGERLKKSGTITLLR